MKRLVLALSLLLLWGINCTKPTGPVSSYGPILYVITDQYWQDGNSRIFFIDTATDSVTDSMLVAFQTFALGVSPDGSKLYLSNAVVDTKTKSLINGAQTGVPSPDGKYLIYSSPSTRTFRVIDAIRDEVFFTLDTLALRIPGTGRPFDTKKGLVYGGYYDPKYNVPSKIGVFDYRNFKLVKLIDPAEILGYDVGVTQIVVTQDGKKVYFLGGGITGGYLKFFAGLHLVYKKVLTLIPLQIAGYLAITDDDRFIYNTEPVGPIIMDECATGKIGRYSPLLEKPLEPIDVNKALCEGLVRGCFPDISCPSGPCGAATGHFAITPDGKKAYSEDPSSGCSVLIIEIESNRVVGEVKVTSEEVHMNSIVIQPPKQFNFK